MAGRVFTLGLALTATMPAVMPAWCATHTITIEGMQFSPAALAVKRGDEVVWVNKDLVPHTATAAASTAFDSKSVAPGQSWRLTATKTGRFDYACTLHPTMKGVLTVEQR